MTDTLREETIGVPQLTFIGGVQDFLAQHMTADNAAKKLQNIEVSNHGTVRRRGGMTLLNTYEESGATGQIRLAKSCRITNFKPFICSLYDLTSGDPIIVIDDGNDDGQLRIRPSLVGSYYAFSDQCDIVPLFDRVYFLEPGERPLYWEPSLTNNLKHEVPNPGEPLTTMPNVGTVAYFQGHAWAGGDLAKPDLIYWSDALDSAEGTTRQFDWNLLQAFRTTTGGIQKIVAFRNVTLLIFCTHGVETIEPNPCNIVESARSTIVDSVGCSNKHTVVLCGEDAVWQDQHGHVRSLKQTALDESQGVTNVPLSQPILNVIARQNKRKLDKSRAFFHDGVYYISWAMGSEEEATEWWGYSFRDRAWFGPNQFQRDVVSENYFAIPVQAWVSHRFEQDRHALPYLVSRTDADEVKCWQILDPEAYDDDGIVIPVELVTKSYMPNAAVRKAWRHIEHEYRFFHSERDASLSATLEIRLDEGEWQSVGTETVSTDAGPDLPETLPFTLVPYARQRAKFSLSDFDGSYAIQVRLKIRESETRWEMVQQLVTGFLENINYAR